MSKVSVRRAAAIAAILAIALVLLSLYQRSPERNEIKGRHASVDVPRSESRPGTRISPLRTAPFLAQQPTEREVRISDLASGRAVVGAMVFADADCTQAYSKAASGEDGKVTVSFPDGMTALSPVYIKTRADFGGAVIPAILPEPPEAELRIPLFARIIVSTSPPFIAESEFQPPEFGFLWCVSWPKPADVVKQPMDKDDSERFESRHRNKEINSAHAPQRNSVPYFDLIERTPGCDKRLAIYHCRSVRPGAEETFDMPFSGEVLLSYFLPDLDTTKTALEVAAGQVYRVAIEAIASRKVTLFIKDEAGNGVPGALVTVALTREYNAKDPAVAFTSSYTPFGSQKTYTSKGWTLTADKDGLVSLRVCSQGPGKLVASASKPRHVGAHLALWSGDGIPDKASYAIELRRAEQASAVLTRLGSPLANCEDVLVTDLGSAEVKFAKQSSDHVGRIDLEQLIIGQRYAVVALTPNGAVHGIFTWNPGITIELK